MVLVLVQEEEACFSNGCLGVSLSQSQKQLCLGPACPHENFMSVFSIARSCLIMRDPIDCSLPISSVQEILPVQIK